MLVNQSFQHHTWSVFHVTPSHAAVECCSKQERKSSNIHTLKTKAENFNQEYSKTVPYYSPSIITLCKWSWIKMHLYFRARTFYWLWLCVCFCGLSYLRVYFHGFTLASYSCILAQVLLRINFNITTEKTIALTNPDNIYSWKKKREKTSSEHHAMPNNSRVCR